VIIIGICGNSGSGKSTVCRILSEMGIPVLDCDLIYHQLTENDTDCLREIKRRFGANVIKNGKLNREVLRQIVFRNPSDLSDLNQLTHRYVLMKLSEQIQFLQKEKQEICIIDAPLFFEAGLETWCQTVCAVVSTQDEQINRICTRDGITKEEAKLRLSKQIPPEVLIQKSDFVIHNIFDQEHLRKECNKLLAFAKQNQKTK